jgi:hypothetical protein
MRSGSTLRPYIRGLYILATTLPHPDGDWAAIDGTMNVTTVERMKAKGLLDSDLRPTA